MIDKFNRQYICQSAQEDTLEIRSFGDGDHRIRFCCEFGGVADSAVFVNLNRKQVGNIITLLSKWVESLPPTATPSPLWRDK